jgi:hypothetical protein
MAKLGLLPWTNRHNVAARAIEAGVDLITLAALLGHSRIAMVQRYAHPGEQHKMEAVRKLEGFWISSRKSDSVSTQTKPNYQPSTALLEASDSPSKLVN